MSKNRKLTLAAAAGAAALFAGPAVPVASADVISFQNGVNGYNGTFDRKFGRRTSDDRDGSAVTGGFALDGGHDTPATLNDGRVVQGLLRFDNIVGPAAIPANALITSATIDVVTPSGGESGGAYNAYRLTSAFDSSSTWAGFGDDGIYGDVARFGGSFNRPRSAAAGLPPVPVSARVDRIVQDWVGGAANHGFGIRSDNTTDGWSYLATGNATAAYRPKLTVNYTTDPNARMVRYQQGVNGYEGTTDLFPNGFNGDTQGASVRGSAIEQAFMDGSNRTATSPGDSYDQPYLIKFDGIDLSAPEVTRAELIVRTGFGSGNAGTGGSFSVHRILEPWDDGTTYASLDADGDATLTPRAELMANGFIDAQASETGAIGNAAVMHLDVTGIVQAWKDGAPNYGIYIGTTGTADAWQIFTSGAFGFGSNSELDGQLAPELSILYVPAAVPEPANLGVIGAGGLLLLRRRRRR